MMNLPNGIGEQAITQVITEHPEIGRILDKYEIGCVTCEVGICQVKDVVSIHALGDDIETCIENELTAYPNKHNQHKGENA